LSQTRRDERLRIVFDVENPWTSPAGGGTFRDQHCFKASEGAPDYVWLKVVGELIRGFQGVLGPFQLTSTVRDDTPRRHRSRQRPLQAIGAWHGSARHCARDDERSPPVMFHDVSVNVLGILVKCSGDENDAMSQTS